MVIKNILFDLDGTLTDPGIGITNSVMYALREMGYPVPEREKLYPFIGPPLIDSFMEFYGMTRKEADIAVTKYREYFSEKGIFENKVYPGTEEMLKTLKESGFNLAIATAKLELFSIRIAEHFGFTDYFDFVAGSLMDETRTKKSEVIKYALEKGGFAPENTVMVGDRKHDVFGAMENKIKCIGVLFGYGSRQELIQAGAWALAERAENIIETVKRVG